MAIGVSEEHEALAASVRGWAERAGVRESARAALDGPEERPSWWSALADQGLLGLHVSTESGGSGAGGVELAVTVEELGRALTPGSALPTLLVSLILAQSPGTAAKELLPGLVDGSVTAAVALSDELTCT
ncbi:MAG: acyl-CoA dehydrogenase domain protein, partial [Frankiales bacterium]|nr:acyl-CoA dehydrogenase domain protein [Frankiales bacterium]